MGTIDVLGIRAVGRHGVLPEEQLRSQPFEVDLRLEADLTKAAATDRLEDTVDYALLTEAVARTVELESYLLLERLADRIAGVCIALDGVTAVEVSVRKLRPPIPVHVTSVGVTLRRQRVTEATSPAPEAEQSPPAPEAEQSPPAPEAEQSAPAPEAHHTPPVLQAGRSAPAPESVESVTSPA